MRPLQHFSACLLLLLVIVSGCNKDKEPPTIPTCSEEGPACISSLGCTEQMVEIPDVSAPLEAEWYNPKAGYTPVPGPQDLWSNEPQGLKKFIVVNSRKEVEKVLETPDSPLMKLDFCQYSALVVEARVGGCQGITEQSLTRRCDMFTFKATMKSSGGCVGGSGTVRYYVVVPKMSKCAQVEFDVTLE